MIDWCSGPLPVVLCCPHDGDLALEGAERRGWFTPSFSRQRDLYTLLVTLGVAEGLNRKLSESPNVVIGRISRTYCDLNRPRWAAYEHRVFSRTWTTYHAQIRAARRRLRKGLLLDIHGTSLLDADIYLGTAYESSLSKMRIAERFGIVLSRLGYRVVFDALRLSGGFTVQWHGWWWSHFDAMQIEICKPLRVDESSRLKLTNDLTTATVDALSHYQQVILQEPARQEAPAVVGALSPTCAV